MNLSNDQLTYWLKLYWGLVILVAIVFIIFKAISKLRRGEMTKPHKSHRAHLQDLEMDHRWRLVKVIYVALSTLVVILCGTNTYMAPVRDEEALWGMVRLAKPDMVGGVMALTIGTVISWTVYRFFLPKLFRYLVPTETTKK